MRASDFGCEPLALIEDHEPKFRDPGRAFNGNEASALLGLAALLDPTLSIT